MTTPEANLTRKFLGLQLYVIESSPARSPETLASLPDHLAHQQDLERRGILFSAGPLWEEGNEIPVAGMIVIRANSFDEARAIADSDPFHQRGIRSYRIRKWSVNEGALQIGLTLSDQSLRFT